jgi:glutamine synthetase type III
MPKHTVRQLARLSGVSVRTLIATIDQTLESLAPGLADFLPRAMRSWAAQAA